MFHFDDEENFQNLSHYTVMDIIGTGSFGTCYKVKHKSMGKCYVWKAVDYGAMSLHEKKLLVTEVNLMGALRHPHIVQYYGRIIHKSSGTLYIVMEWCRNGDLDSLINTCRQDRVTVDEKFVWKVLYQSAKALEACHSLLHHITVLHRDIKPANIFLDENHDVKLGDFGLAKILRKNVNFSRTVVGTPYYMSPEQIRGMKYNQKCDVWSLGCLLYELCTLHQPFSGCNLNELKANISFNKLARIPVTFSEYLDKMVKLLLNSNYEFRPSVEMIVHHPTVICNYNRSATPFESAGSNSKHGNGKVSKGEIVTLPSQRSRNRDNLDTSDERKSSVVGEFNRSSGGIPSSCNFDPQKLSEDVYDKKLIDRLKLLRVKETTLKAKEDSLMHKERCLKTREISLFQKQAQIEKLERKIVALRCKSDNVGARETLNIRSKNERRRVSDVDLESTAYSADTGDITVAPTAVKLDPSKIIKPSFFKADNVKEKNTECANKNEDIFSRQPFAFLHNHPIAKDKKVKRSVILEKCRQFVRT